MVKIDRIIHSRRKSFALVVEPDGSLTVRAPLRAAHAQIEHLVQEKSDWIQEKQEWLRRHPDAYLPKNYKTGELFYYLGKTYPLEIVPTARPLLQLKNGRFLLAQTALPRAIEVFSHWYRDQARQIIGQQVKVRASEQGWVFRSLHITSANRRWGSCGVKGTLNFSWRLVMAPPAVIDYVVVHELVHLEIKNHSRSYWERVAQILPEYKKQIAWLKSNGRRLHL
jgi:predicted metal-dependent hydrolase